MERLSTGLPQLDAALGGGLLPGTLSMIIGATGVGKTQLGMHFIQAGGAQEDAAAGAVIDLSSRGDSQNHAGYAERMFGRSLRVAEPHTEFHRQPFSNGRPADLLAFLGYGGRRVLRSQMDSDQWHSWQSELNQRLPRLTGFVYSHLIHGTRRFLIDGIEPLDSASDSLQLDLLEWIYHRLLRQEHDWLAREVLREKFLANRAEVDRHAYCHQEAAAVVLITTKLPMLDQLMSEPLADGDLAAGANTVIFLGRVQSDGQVGRAMYIAKHRGSYADSRILPFEINQSGIEFHR